MSVSALNWKYIGKSTLGGSAAIDDVLDAIYTLFAKSTYDDGSSRTTGTLNDSGAAAGSGVAWTPSKFQNSGTTEAVYLVPSTAGSSTNDNMRVIFAGATSEPSNFPLFNQAADKFPNDTGDGTGVNHTWTNSQLYGGIAKNAGSFTNLSPGADTTPFTSGGFTGFALISDAGHNANGILYAYECLDCIWLNFQDGSSATGYVDTFTAGGLIDPGSTSSLDGEADYVLYGMMSSGNVGHNNPAAGNVAYFPSFGASDNNRAAVVFTPGATSYTNIPIVQNVVTNNNGSGGVSENYLKSGKLTLIPIYFSRYYDAGGIRHTLGRWREVFGGPISNTGQEISSGGTVQGYLTSQRGLGQTPFRGLVLKA